MTKPLPIKSVSKAKASHSPAHLKYMKLLRIIEELGRDLKPCYTGNNLYKMMPKVERNLIQASRLVQQCRVEIQKNEKKTCE
jgi:hypothetical protein